MPYINVTPCDTCMDRANENGYDNGYDKGFDEGKASAEVHT